MSQGNYGHPGHGGHWRFPPLLWALAAFVLMVILVCWFG